MRIATIIISRSNTGQAINLPDDMQINDHKVYIKKVGNALHIIPFHNAWQNLIDSTNLFTDDFMAKRDVDYDQPSEAFD